MSTVRLFSIYDMGTKAFMRPFFSDHEVLAKRSFTTIVNDKSNPDNMIAAHPDQFVLYELSIFDYQSGEFITHSNPISLGKAVEFVNAS